VHDVFAIYERPEDPAAFDQHYAEVHVPKALAMPDLVELTWGKVEGDGEGPYLICRMTYPDAATAAASLSSPAGEAAVADLAAFASAGVAVYDVPRS
jgi:uncharacterized protein (TIGR02118 family)